MDWQKVIDELRKRADEMEPIAQNRYKDTHERTVAAVGVVVLGAIAESLRAGLPPEYTVPGGQHDVAEAVLINGMTYVRAR